MKSIVGHPFGHHCLNGRRLVTSLILVITTIILLILLIVNLNCNIFTEASVNTTSLNAAPLTTHIQKIVTTKNNNDKNNNYNFTTQTTSSTTTTTTTTSTTFTDNGLGKISNGSTDTDMVGTVGSVLAKIQKSESSNSIISGSNEIIITSTSLGSLQLANDSNSSSTNGSIIDDVIREDGPCQSTAPTKNSINNINETSKYFDIDYASKTFEESMADKNAISLDHYLEGFKELMKFFHNLGSIFLFVTSDLEAKINLLENYRNFEKGGCNPAYLTIQSAIEYETKENLLRDSKRQSGARTILRLHRALEFLSMMMLNLSKLDEDSETAPAARDAYSNSLAQHHPWTIRTIASIAMRTLPQKKNLVESVLGKEHSGNDTATNEKMLILANVTENLFNVVDKYYEDRSIKDLP